MYSKGSVDFNNDIELRDLFKLEPSRIYLGWLDRIEQYYLSAAESMDIDGNGFASMVMVLCAVDAIGAVLTESMDSTYRVRKSLGAILTNLNRREAVIDASNIEEVTKHLYYQYRCGLVHSGFTRQFGRYRENNAQQTLFLMSYESDCVVKQLKVEGKIVFIVNPSRLKSAIRRYVGQLRGKPPHEQRRFGSKIRESLKTEISVADLLKNKKI